MNRLRGGKNLGLLLLLGPIAAGLLIPRAGPSPAKDKPPSRELVVEPGGTPEDARLAAQESDEYAWRLFLFLNRQARARRAGVADPDKPALTDYDPDRDVVWETWAHASADGATGGEVFLPQGAKPVAWDKLDRGRRRPKKLARNRTGLAEPAVRPVGFLLSEEEGGMEVRLNRATFDAIRDNDWYSREGLIAAFQKATAAGDRDFIQFPPAAKAVKAMWLPIKDADKPRYHWRTSGNTVYGLKALHVTTKDLPLWFWCDFIHADLEPREPAGSMHDATTRGPGARRGQNGVRAATAGSKWENYRLKGSQTAFTDARGTPTVLGNQLLEGGNAARSSCITCHAMAGIDKAGGVKHAPFSLGLPSAAEFGSPGILFLQSDFLYAMPFRAQSTKD